MEETEVGTEKLLQLERTLNEAKVALSNELITEKEYDEALANFHEEYQKVRYMQRGGQ